MALEYRFLNRNLFSPIYKCFQEAFADYKLDMSYMTPQAVFNRFVKNGVDFESSVGVYDQDKMVAFTIIGIDKWKGDLAAFDSATGVIPEYRGKEIAIEIFKFAEKKLRILNVKRFLLEVLQDNAPAVRAYTKAGFSVIREFDCFELKLPNFDDPVSKKNPPEVKPVERKELDSFGQDLEWHPSWENSISAIKRIPDDVQTYGAFSGKRCVGILAYYPLLKWILTIVVKRQFRRQGVGGQLVAHCIKNLDPNTKEIKVLNIEHSDYKLSSLLNKIGFQKNVDQFEMEYLF